MSKLITEAKFALAGWMRRAARRLDGYPVEVIRRIHTADGEETFAPSKHLPIKRGH